MKEELDNLLYQRYPKIFSERHESTSGSNMAYGICCNDGWFDLLDVLCGQLQIWTDRANVPQVTATQVKEKFGALCFYYTGGNEYAFGMVAMAQAMSTRLCELCGHPGTLETKGGWYRVRCKTHSGQRG